MNDKARNEIDDKYKWDLTDFYKTDEEFYQDCEEVIKIIDELAKYKGKVTQNGQSLYEFLTKTEEFYARLNTIDVYGHWLRYTIDMTDNDAQKIKLKADSMFKYYREKLSFIENELYKADLNKLQKGEPKLRPYKRFLDSFIKGKKHRLSDKEENIISKTQNITNQAFSIYNNITVADAKFGTININGEEIQLNRTNYQKFIKHENRDIRRKAYQTRNQFYKDYKNSICNTFQMSVNKVVFDSTIHKFNSPLEQFLFEQELSTATFDTLMSFIPDQNGLLKRFEEVKRKLLKLDKLHDYDLALEPKLNISNTIEYDKAIAIIQEALKIFGDEYANNLTKMLNNHLIDVYPNKGKRTNGYEISSYKQMPRVLYNYHESISDVYNLAHEIGHAMHAYYTNKNQPYLYYDNKHLQAETASLTNEVVLTDYLIKQAKTKDEKIYYLISHLDQVTLYFFITGICAKQEHQFYQRALENNPMTADEMCQSYYDLFKAQYEGSNRVIEEEVKYTWMLRYQYHTPYYFAQYALAMSAALATGYNIINQKPGFKEKYLDFLASGDSIPTRELYKNLDIDLENSKTYEDVLKYIEEKVSLLEELIK